MTVSRVTVVADGRVFPAGIGGEPAPQWQSRVLTAAIPRPLSPNATAATTTSSPETSMNKKNAKELVDHATGELQALREYYERVEAEVGAGTHWAADLGRLAEQVCIAAGVLLEGLFSELFVALINRVRLRSAHAIIEQYQHVSDAFH